MTFSQTDQIFTESHSLTFYYNIKVIIKSSIIILSYYLMCFLTDLTEEFNTIDSYKYVVPWMATRGSTNSYIHQVTWLQFCFLIKHFTRGSMVHLSKFKNVEEALQRSWQNKEICRARLKDSKWSAAGAALFSLPVGGDGAANRDMTLLKHTSQISTRLPHVFWQRSSDPRLDD